MPQPVRVLVSSEVTATVDSAEVVAFTPVFDRLSSSGCVGDNLLGLNWLIVFINRLSLVLL